MVESVTPEPRSPEEARQLLHSAAQLLRASSVLEKETKQPLAELIEELRRLLETTPVPSAEMRHLSECVAQLVRAIQEPHASGLLSLARERLDKAISFAEVETPVAVGLARRVMSALSNMGI